MGITTLGAERATNPFLAELAQVRRSSRRPRGTLDVLPADGAPPRSSCDATARACSSRAGYEPIETPVFEDTEVFARGVGESTDIVQKEMFTFEDKAGRSLTLRPEATAGDLPRLHRARHAQAAAAGEALVRRARSSATRRRRPGRFRQFTQIDAEAIGSDDPSLDAELILLLDEILERAGHRAAAAAAVEPRHARDARASTSRS